MEELESREDVRCENIMAQRDIDDEMAYGSVFAKKCES